ncbi:MAG: hypothetical protein ACOYJX_01080 [Acutalibacteraceae bacterium]
MQNNSKNNPPFSSFVISLILRGEKKDLDLLSSSIEIMPTDTYAPDGNENGELDAWYFRIKSESLEQLEVVSNEFFDKIKDINFILDKIITIKAEINLHVHAELAQIHFELPQSMLDNLVQIKIPFGISILSWGMVEDK